ncbi:MAG: GNAT family N-acetyltransferase [Kiloniellales bacterium]
MVELLTPRLSLRPFQGGDLPRLLEAMNDWAVQQWLDTPSYPYGAENGEAWIDKSGREHAEGQPATFAIAARSDDCLLGCIGQERNGETVTLGYWLHTAAWGQGFATEAAQAYLAYCRERLHMAHLTAFTDPENAASWRVLEKIGFRHQGHEARCEPTRRGSATWRRFEWREEVPAAT